MHFEILVEDQSGKKALDIIIPRIIGKNHTFKVIPYKGIGRIPKNLRSKSEVKKRILLDQLPRLLRGYGKTFSKYPGHYSAAVFVVCDLDESCLKKFRRQLYTILNGCNTKPNTRFCIAIEEGEAWFLGDHNAIKKAYPKAKETILKTYINDSICGTWELLADAVYAGGSQSLLAKNWQAVGAEKSAWAENISYYMNVEENISPSFCYFRDKMREVAGILC